MQSIIPSIRRSGVSSQWTVDVTEHAHITEIKVPAAASNNNNYEPQICRYLDHAEKCRSFEFITSLLGQHGPESPTSEIDSGPFSDTDSDGDSTSVIENEPKPPSTGTDSIPVSPGYARPITNYFAIAAHLCKTKANTIPLPLRTFSVNNNTAIHLAYSPSIRRMAINDVAEKYGLPDLLPALADFLNKEKACGPGAVHSIGGQRRASATSSLPFKEVQTWFKVRVQTTEFDNPSVVVPAQTFYCSPPDENWSFGRYDTAIFNVDPAFRWPGSGLKGSCTVCAMHTIFTTTYRSSRMPASTYLASPWTQGHGMALDRSISGIRTSV